MQLPFSILIQSLIYTSRSSTWKKSSLHWIFHLPNQAVFQISFPISFNPHTDIKTLNFSKTVCPEFKNFSHTGALASVRAALHFASLRHQKGFISLYLDNVSREDSAPPPFLVAAVKDNICVTGVCFSGAASSSLAGKPVFDTSTFFTKKCFSSLSVTLYLRINSRRQRGPHVFPLLIFHHFPHHEPADQYCGTGNRIVEEKTNSYETMTLLFYESSSQKCENYSCCLRFISYGSEDHFFFPSSLICWFYLVARVFITHCACDDEFSESKGRGIVWVKN